jgi:hypothetical protein
VYQPNQQPYRVPVLSHNVLMAARAVERSLSGSRPVEPTVSDKHPNSNRPQRQWLPEDLGEYPPLDSLVR